MYRMAIMALIAADVPGLSRERFDLEFLMLCYLNNCGAFFCFGSVSLVVLL